MEAITGKTKNVNEQLTLMGAIFGRGSIDLAALRNEWGRYSSAVATSDVNEYLKDSDIKSKNMTSAFNRLGTVALKLGDAALAPMLDQISNAITSIDPDDIKNIASAFEAFGKVIAMSVDGYVKLAGALQLIMDLKKAEDIRNTVQAKALEKEIGGRVTPEAAAVIKGGGPNAWIMRKMIEMGADDGSGARSLTNTPSNGNPNAPANALKGLSVDITIDSLRGASYKAYVYNDDKAGKQVSTMGVVK
jgi:hypothetical protein